MELSQNYESTLPTLSAPAPLRRWAAATKTTSHESIFETFDEESIRLSTVWTSLVTGAARVADCYFTETECCLVIAPVNAPGGPLMPRSLLELLVRTVSGESQKNLAIELGMAASTIAARLRTGLDSLGVSTRASRLHPVLMLAARAARTGDHTAMATRRPAAASGELEVIGLKRPESRFSRALSRAELDIAAGLLEGHSHQEIARRRGTSARTIANQIAAVFRRLDISGRNDLVLYMFGATSGSGTLERVA